MTSDPSPPRSTPASNSLHNRSWVEPLTKLGHMLDGITPRSMAVMTALAKTPLTLTPVLGAKPATSVTAAEFATKPHTDPDRNREKKLAKLEPEKADDGVYENLFELNQRGEDKTQTGSVRLEQPTVKKEEKENTDPMKNNANILTLLVLDLIYWRDAKKSGIALAAILAVLFVFTRFPLITVLSYSGLAALAGTVGFRVLKLVEAQIKKTDAGNPFQPYLEQDISVPQDRVHEQVDVLVEHGQCLTNQLRRLFLVENLVDSVKFGLLLWTLTYIGAWFSGPTLAFLAVVAVFSIPKIYETYQEPIDAQLEVVKGHIDNVTNIVEEKLPFLKRAAAVAEEKKDQVHEDINGDHSSLVNGL